MSKSWSSIVFQYQYPPPLNGGADRFNVQVIIFRSVVDLTNLSHNDGCISYSSYSHASAVCSTRCHNMGVHPQSTPEPHFGFRVPSMLKKPEATAGQSIGSSDIGHFPVGNTMSKPQCWREGGKPRSGLQMGLGPLACGQEHQESCHPLFHCIIFGNSLVDIGCASDKRR
jgi:hypothetical protein